MEEKSSARALGKITVLVRIQGKVRTSRGNDKGRRRRVGYGGGTHAVLYVRDHNKAPSDQSIYHTSEVYLSRLREAASTHFHYKFSRFSRRFKSLINIERIIGLFYRFVRVCTMQIYFCQITFHMEREKDLTLKLSDGKKILYCLKNVACVSLFF